jgi:hypothetical protein
MVKDKILFKATGGLKVGESFIYSAQATWPFGKIEMYKDKLVLLFDIPQAILQRFARGVYRPKNKFSKIPQKIVLNYKDITGYRPINLPIIDLILGKSLLIVHKNKKYPPYINVILFGNKIKRVIEILESKCKKRADLTQSLFEKIMNLGGCLLILYLIGTFIFSYDINKYIVIIYVILFILFYMIKNFRSRGK